MLDFTRREHGAAEVCHPCYLVRVMQVRVCVPTICSAAHIDWVAVGSPRGLLGSGHDNWELAGGVIGAVGGRARNREGDEAQ